MTDLVTDGACFIDAHLVSHLVRSGRRVRVLVAQEGLRRVVEWYRR